MRDDTAVRLLAEARELAPMPVRRPTKKGDLIVASVIENPYLGTATLFVQLLPADVGMRPSHHERRKEL
jgi:hypothetical protein